ncbi:MAG: leucine dehydrogenase [Myxococcales bacterium]|nr:leucine dehydrogenase [Myxococcales bacterium]
MDDVFALLAETDVERCMLLTDTASGLQAILVLDDLTLGPAAGGVRTAKYPNFASALREAQQLARAMTHKCALADIGAGGGKIVVIDHDALIREAAFEALGSHLENLEGLFRTSGDYGTTQRDLRAMARKTRYVQSDGEHLVASVGQSVLRCIEAIQQFRGAPARVDGLKVAIQGCGSVGASVARALASQGANLIVSDINKERAKAVATESGATIVDPEDIIHIEADVLAPCAIGGWLNENIAEELAARAVCGPANNVLTNVAAAERLQARGIIHVPDAISSAGAVIEGIGRAVMGLPDRTPLIDHLGRTALTVLRNAREKGITPYEAAEALAQARLALAR